MDAREYQHKTGYTAVYRDRNLEFAGQDSIGKAWYALNIHYVTLGLVGEAGEIANKVKKQLRDNPKDPFNDEFKIMMFGELGDVMWYVSQMCNELGLDLEGIMEANIDKLESRKERDVLGGSGDER